MPDWVGDGPAGHWQDHAACAGLDTEAFFPEPTRGRAQTVPPELVLICGGCPVRTACLEHAISSDERGVWGGTTESDRRAMNRRIRRAKCPACSSPDIADRSARVRTQTCTACGISWQATVTPSRSRSRRPNLGLRRVA